jgi:GTP-binding protein
LTAYNPELLDKPKILAISKSDMLDDQLEREMSEQVPKGIPYLFISSVTGKNIQQLKDLIWKEINQ